MRLLNRSSLCLLLLQGWTRALARSPKGRRSRSSSSESSSQEDPLTCRLEERPITGTILVETSAIVESGDDVTVGELRLLEELFMDSYNALLVPKDELCQDPIPPPPETQNFIQLEEVELEVPPSTGKGFDRRHRQRRTTTARRGEGDRGGKQTTHQQKISRQDGGRRSLQAPPPSSITPPGITPPGVTSSPSISASPSESMPPSTSTAPSTFFNFQTFSLTLRYTGYCNGCPLNRDIYNDVDDTSFRSNGRLTGAATNTTRGRRRELFDGEHDKGEEEEEFNTPPQRGLRDGGRRRRRRRRNRRSMRDRLSKLEPSEEEPSSPVEEPSEEEEVEAPGCDCDPPLETLVLGDFNADLADRINELVIRSFDDLTYVSEEECEAEIVDFSGFVLVTAVAQSGTAISDTEVSVLEQAFLDNYNLLDVCEQDGAFFHLDRVLLTAGVDPNEYTLVDDEEQSQRRHLRELFNGRNAQQTENVLFLLLEYRGTCNGCSFGFELVTEGGAGLRGLQGEPTTATSSPSTEQDVDFGPCDCRQPLESIVLQSFNRDIENLRAANLVSEIVSFQDLAQLE